MTVQVGTYVAIGDSFTCGHDESVTSWAEFLAAGLGPSVRYVNLAEVGATSVDVETIQVPRAIAAQPDIVSVVCGANDVLRATRPDVEAYTARLRRIFAALAHAQIVTGTYPRFDRFAGFGPRTRARVVAGIEQLNAAIRVVAHECGVLLVDRCGHPDVIGRASFAADGLHPSTEGHRRTAEAVLAAIRRLPRPVEAGSR